MIVGINVDIALRIISDQEASGTSVSRHRSQGSVDYFNADLEDSLREMAFLPFGTDTRTVLCPHVSAESMGQYSRYRRIEETRPSGEPFEEMVGSRRLGTD